MTMELRHEIIEELHRPARRMFPRRHTVLKGIDDLYQADLVEMIPYSKLNRGYKYILTIINCFSKVADAIPLKDKSATAVTNAMKRFLNNNAGKIKLLQTDNGKEFYNSLFNSLMKKHGITHYSTFSEMKAAIVERFNRTLKGAMYKRFSQRGSYKWHDILSDLVQKYNNSFHRTIGMKPVSVNKRTKRQVELNIKKNLKARREGVAPKKFEIDDRVRISKHRTVFSKGYLPNWTNEVFTVYRVQPTVPETYLLKDGKGEILQGAFYGHELLKSKVGDVYLIEKVLKRTKDRLLVRWIGFDKSHDSWIDKKDLV